MIQGPGNDKGLDRVNSDRHPEDEEKSNNHKGRIHLKNRDGGSTPRELHKLEVSNKIHINQKTDKYIHQKSNISITERDIGKAPLALKYEYQRPDNEDLLDPLKRKNQILQDKGKLGFVGEVDIYRYRESDTTGKTFRYTFEINDQKIFINHCLGSSNTDEIQSIDALEEALHNLPPALLKVVDRIHVHPKSSLREEVWRRKYNLSEASKISMSSGGGGEINIFPGARSKYQIKRDLFHECGHLVDDEISWLGYSNAATGKKTQMSKAELHRRWQVAVDRDPALPRDYATCHVCEDIAESVMEYFSAADRVFSGYPNAMNDFAQTYPERYKILEDIFEHSKVVEEKRVRLAREEINNVLKTASEAEDSNDHNSLRTCISKLKSLDPGNVLIPELEEDCSRIEAEHLEKQKTEVIENALEASRNNDSRALKRYNSKLKEMDPGDRNITKLEESCSRIETEHLEKQKTEVIENELKASRNNDSRELKRYISKLKEMDPDDQHILELKELSSKAKRKRKVGKTIKSALRAIRNENSDKLLDLILKLARLDPHNENISKLEKKYVEMQESIEMKKIIKSKIEY